MQDAGRWLFAGLQWSLVLSFVIGCGSSDRGYVVGTIVHRDGTPLVGARVIARSATSGKSANGQTDGEGKFELGTNQTGDGVAPGDYYVVVLEDRGIENNRLPPTISDKYGGGSTSGLKFSVNAGEKAKLDWKLDPK